MDNVLPRTACPGAAADAAVGEELRRHGQEGAAVSAAGHLGEVAEGYDNNFLELHTTININDTDGAHPGRRADQPVRRQRYAMDLAAPRSHRAPRPDGARHRQRHQPANQLTPAGQIGGPPAQAPVPIRSAPGTAARRCGVRRDHPSHQPGRSEVRLKDVARIELGTMLYNAVGRHDGTPAAVIVFQIQAPTRWRSPTPSRRPWRIWTRFRATWTTVSLDTTLPVTEGINEIVRRSSKRSRSSSSSSSSSCRTGGRHPR